MTDDDNTASKPGRPSDATWLVKAMTVSAVLALLAGMLQLSAAGLAARAWGPAQLVDANTGAINTVALEGCPIESPDGHYLFLASNRDGTGGIDIWASYRASVGGEFGAPGNLPGAVFPEEAVNSEVNDFCPTPLTGNRLLFVSNRAGECGANPNIYETRLDPALGWLPPQLLPCGAADSVNGFAEELSPSLVEAGGRTLLFFSSNRGGGHDVYVSERQPNGDWGPAVPVDELNTDADDARPNVSHDGLEIVFDSTRGGGPPDIWTATRSRIDRQWSAPVRLGPNVNSGAAETRPSLSRDGTRLYFGSTRAREHEGIVDTSSNIYVSTRSVPGSAR